MVRQARSVVPMDFPSIGVPWLLHALAKLYGRSRVAGVMPVLATVVISELDAAAGEERGADGLPVDRRALAAACAREAVRAIARRRRDAGAGQRRDLEHLRTAGAAVRDRKSTRLNS